MKKKIAFFQNIRFQLPLTYAGIALLGAVLIGAILVLVMDSYYQGLEKEYVTGNASGLARNLNGMAAREKIGAGNTLQNNQSFLQNQARAAAFLIQSRVRILDTSGGLIADSGTPTQGWYIRVPSAGGAAERAAGADLSATALAATPQPAPLGAQATPQAGSPLSFEPAPGSPQPPRDSSPFAFGFPASRSMYGFNLEEVASVDGPRSAYKSEAAITAADGSALGTVEVSEGPAYGREILTNVVQGWAIASLIALIASGGIGWLVSRQITRPIVVLEEVTSAMQEGNLAVRAPRLGPAELTSLADGFNRMAARIEGDMKTLQRFVSDAAHELRTPLTALRADLDMAAREKDETRVKELVGRSLQQVTRLEQLSKDLLDLSKIETSTGQEVFQPVDLAPLLRRVSEVHASAAEQAGVDFTLDLPEERLTVTGNDLQLGRAVNNLLENAVKFTPAGGRITLRLEREDQDALLTVEDTGIGIAPAERDQLFSRFHRGRNTRGYPGSGLGLAIARAIIDRHGGEIGLAPSDEVTRFFIRLPLASSAAKN